MNMPNGWNKAHEASTLHKNLQAPEESWQWEGGPFQGRAHQLIVQRQEVGTENRHTAMCGLNKLCLGIYMYL